MSAENFYRQGKNEFDAENYQKALQFFQSALEEEQAHMNSRYGRAMTLFKMARFEEAIQDFDVLVLNVPDNASYWSERAVALHLSGKNEKAILNFNKAVELEPENPYRYSSRAYVRERMQDYQGAWDDYTKAIELDPNDAIAYNNRGLVEERLGYKDKAKESFSQADKISGVEQQRSAAKTASQQVDRQAKQRPEDAGIIIESEEETKKPALGDYLKVMTSVFSSKESLREFMSFVGNIFRKNKS